MKKVICILLSAMLCFTFFGCGDGEGEEKQVLRVYNCGEYIDEDLIGEFEELYGIEVVYDTFSTLEEMYPKIEADPASYDVVCPSEYMVKKMISKGLLQKVDKEKLPNLPNITPQISEILDDYFESGNGKGNEYMVPYCWGTVGILYNTTLVDEEPTSWDVLWDEKYKGQILMQDSVRDAFMVAQKKLGYSLNSKDEKEIAACSQLLHEQYPLVKAYVIDEVRDKMIAGYTAMGVIYSGEYLYCTDEEEGNTDLAFVIPEEGTNVWYDGWVITAGCKNVDAAHLWMNYLLDAEVAARNFDYITYPTPNEAAKEFIDEEILEDPAVFPPEELIEKCEVYEFLGEEIEDMYYEYWKKVK